jgi:hypothetical protein
MLTILFLRRCDELMVAPASVDTIIYPSTSTSTDERLSACYTTRNSECFVTRSSYK